METYGSIVSTETFVNTRMNALAAKSDTANMAAPYVTSFSTSHHLALSGIDPDTGSSREVSIT